MRGSFSGLNSGERGHQKPFFDCGSQDCNKTSIILRKEMIKNLLLDLELATLEDFFGLNMRRDKWEIEQILSDYERGKYSTADDLDNALFTPINRLEISMHAVYYELTSTIEFEMRSLASLIFLPVNK